jgi:hypothetical protein
MATFDLGSLAHASEASRYHRAQGTHWHRQSGVLEALDKLRLGAPVRRCARAGPIIVGNIPYRGARRRPVLPSRCWAPIEKQVQCAGHMRLGAARGSPPMFKFPARVASAEAHWQSLALARRQWPGLSEHGGTAGSAARSGSGCDGRRRRALAAALGALPSGVVAMVAEAVAALGYADV